MTKPVTGLVQFGNSAGPDHTGDLDTNYNLLAAAINDLSTASNYLTDSSGAPNTITVTVPVGLTFSLTPGVLLQVKIANTTTSGTVNMNVGGTGNVPVTNPDGSALSVGQLTAGMVVMVLYDGTHFQIQSGQVSQYHGNVTVNGISGVAAVTIATPATVSATLGFSQSGQTTAFLYQPASSSNLVAQAGGADRLVVGSTGVVTINAAASSDTFIVTGNASGFAAVFHGSGTAGNSRGLYVGAGTNNSDFALQVQNQAQNKDFFRVVGDGSFVLGNSGSVNIVTGSAAGNVTLAAPTSGLALVVNGLSGATSTMQLNVPGAATNADFYVLANNGNVAAGGKFSNHGTGSVATTYFSCENDVGNNVAMEITSSTFSGSVITGAPTGQCALMGSTGTIPLVLMTNHIVCAKIDSNQNWTIPAPSVGTAMTINAAASANALIINGVSGTPGLHVNTFSANDVAAIFSAGPGNGSVIQFSPNAGTNTGFFGLSGSAGEWTPNSAAGDFVMRNTGALRVSVDNGVSEKFIITSAGAIQGVGPTNGVTDMTPDQGSFTGTITGGTTAPTVTCNWYKIGKTVTLLINGVSVTSNSTAFTMTGLPAELQPATLTAQQSPNVQATNNSATVFNANAVINNGSGTVTFVLNGSATGWTNAGTKAVNNFVIQYLLI